MIMIFLLPFFAHDIFKTIVYNITIHYLGGLLMSCIVYQTDKKTGVKYAYESTSYWDKDKKQPRSKRKYIGKVDPETGEIISSRRRKNIPANTDNDQNHTYLAAISQLQEDLLEKESQIRQLQTDLTELSVKYNKAEKLFAEIVSSVNTFIEKSNV